MRSWGTTVTQADNPCPPPPGANRPAAERQSMSKEMVLKEEK